MIHCYWLTMKEKIGWSGEWEEISLPSLSVATYKDPNQQFINCTLFETFGFLKDKTRQDETRRDKTRQDKTRQDKTRQDKTRQDKTRQDKTRQDKARQDKTRQDKAGHGEARHGGGTSRVGSARIGTGKATTKEKGSRCPCFRPRYIEDPVIEELVYYFTKM